MTKEAKHLTRSLALLAIIYLLTSGLLLGIDIAAALIYGTALLPVALVPVMALGVVAMFAFGIWAAGRQGQSAEDQQLARDNDNWIYVAVGLGAMLLVATPLVILLGRFY